MRLTSVHTYLSPCETTADVSNDAQGIFFSDENFPRFHLFRHLVPVFIHFSATLSLIPIIEILYFEPAAWNPALNALNLKSQHFHHGAKFITNSEYFRV